MNRIATWYAPLVLLLLTPLMPAAQDFGSNFSADDAAGKKMVDETSKSVDNITNLLMGPGMYVIMAVGAVLSLYGFGRGQKETLFTGIGLFVFAAIIRGVWTFIGDDGAAAA